MPVPKNRSRGIKIAPSYMEILDPAEDILNHATNYVLHLAKSHQEEWGHDHKVDLHFNDFWAWYDCQHKDCEQTHTVPAFTTRYLSRASRIA